MNENVNVCITPKGEKPVLHFSQFDNENIFTVTVLADDGESAAVLTGLDIEFRIRKTDSHVVTIAPESVADNVITFKSTEQMCACCGQNIASVVLMKDDMNIATLDILVEIQRDILSGGLTSESDIRNLTTQIEQIVPEVVGDDYYNKQEVDELIAEHTFDPSNYYDKQEVDDLLAEHTFDPTNYYDKSDVDDLLEDKADADDVYTKAETDNLLADKADKSAIASLIVQKDVAKAPIASFNTDLAEALTKIIVDINPVQSGSGTPSPQNVRPISGFSALNVTRTGKNLFSYDLTIRDGYWTNNAFVGTNAIVQKENAMTWQYIRVYVEGLSSITLSGFDNQGGTNCAWLSSENVNDVISKFNSLTKNGTKTVPSGAKYLCLTIFNIKDKSTIYPNAQIEIGNQATSFEPYNGQTASVNFGQIVYGGSLDVTGGKVTAIYSQSIKLSDITGWSYDSTYQYFYTTIADKKSGNINLLCECYSVVDKASATQLLNGEMKGHSSSRNVYIKDTNYTDVTNWLNAVGNNRLIYELATPIEITTTPENLTALSGQNNVYGDTNGDTEVRFTETIGNELGV